MTLTGFVVVGVGGALGAMARYGLMLLMPRQLGELPLATLLSNLLGCLLIGAALQWIADSAWLAGTRLAEEPLRLLVAVGFCGAFTTLSSLVLELAALIERNDVLLACSYLAATLAGGFACFYLGLVLMRALLSPSS